MKLFQSIPQHRELTHKNPIFLIFAKFLALYLNVGIVLRVVFMFTAPTELSLGSTDVLRFLIVGQIGDLGMGLLLSIPLALLYSTLHDGKYAPRVGWAIELGLVVAFAYSWWQGSIFHEYGGGAPLVAHILLGWKLLSFTVRLLVPRLRKGWRRVSLYVAWFTYVLLTFFVSVGEVFFWQEFGVRYNFIAVDYLVYTTEVIGNIMESYAIVPLSIIIVLLSVALLWWQSRRYRFKSGKLFTMRSLVVQLVAWAALCGAGFGLVWFTHSLESENAYVTQLEQNGACDFIIAFKNNRLEYDRFYLMMPEGECKRQYRELAGLNEQGNKMLATGTASTTKPCNIVLITVESLSADFMARYGCDRGVTPCLDALVPRCLVLDSLYANGNRTVRGLEALSLCIPPNAGESIVKQKNNRMGSLSIGATLKKQGYTVQYLYGGHSYFDNMGDYFSNNGYEVIDRADFAPNEITFANIWGVCDGDMFDKSLKVFDANAQTGRPFFAQIMTTSNHRPFTYPQGFIKVDGDPNTRDAAVKYTDYAIGKFLRDAQSKPWFANTVFIVIADHCASSAGKTSLPIESYHIPCLIYAPMLVKPQAVKTLCSQIDVLPTLLPMLGMNAKVQWAGRNIFAPDYKPRAFMATYQDLGYLEQGVLTVLSPVRKVQQFNVTYAADGTAVETPLATPRPDLTRKAQAYYQYVNLYLPR